ncbi:hypothetical protein VQH23_16555 [Pararoseomonas sp. SCSIO 73927]|uniref:hypothetical protein n=1 Tax=Pararoseomonas sp. SCSIO 73927 TaxID=3114537 RepID=UPI0030D26839
MSLSEPPSSAWRKRLLGFVMVVISVGAPVMTTTSVASSRVRPHPESPGRQWIRPALLSAQQGNERMSEFKIGDTVRITGPVMRGNVGTVVWKDDSGQRYLVRITAATQNYYPAAELELFRP